MHIIYFLEFSANYVYFNLLVCSYLLIFYLSFNKDYVVYTTIMQQTVFILVYFPIHRKLFAANVSLGMIWPKKKGKTINGIDSRDVNCEQIS